MIGTILYKPIEDYTEYVKCSSWCNENNATIEDKGDYYEVVEIKEYQPSEEEKLLFEKEELKLWLSNHDYIGTKIATGRATVEEYADIIKEMKIKANRINEINELLK